MTTELYGGVLGEIPTLVPYQGKSYINPRKRHQKQVWVSNPAGFQVPANQQLPTTLTAPRDQGRDGDVELWAIHATSTGRFAVQFELQAWDRRLSNQPVESSLIFGASHLPGRFLESIFIPSSSALKINCQDLSGNANTIALTGFGQQLQAPSRTLSEQARIAAKSYHHPFWLTWDAGAQIALTASQNVTRNMTVPGDAHFEAFGWVARSDGAFSLEVFEGNQRSCFQPQGVIPSGRVIATTGQLTSDGAVAVPAASLPTIFPTSWLLAPNTTLRFSVTDTSVAGNNVSIALFGRLLYFSELPPGVQAA